MVPILCHDSRCVFIASLVVLLATWFASAPGMSAEIEFNRDVRQILSDRCFSCHGPDAAHREADLRLDDEDSAKELAIVAGDPNASELVARITADDPDMKMPPVASRKKLSKEEIALLIRWIEEGAQYQPQWAYVPPQRHPLPKIDEDAWPKNWIDHFIADRLRAEGLRPSPEADRVTQIRRLGFDLLGLPPTPDEVDAFVRDDTPEAYERLVDRLLASPHFGERMAMYWLDLVRYADTVGYHGDQDHNVSPYRDYVIRVFNENVPFDQFTREQLAGDLLAGNVLDGAGTDEKIASGYNRLLQTSHEGGVQLKEYRAIYAADRVRNVSAVWMGATLGCCQCHDHKFDPYATKDFYAMAAFFADIDDERHITAGAPNSVPTIRAPELPLPTPEQERQITQAKAEIAVLEMELKKASDGESEGDAGGEPTDEDASDEEVLESINDRLRKRKQSLAAIERSVRRTLTTVALATPRTTRVLSRGDWLDETGEVVEPAIPEFLGSLPASDRRANRLDLANWLTSVDDAVGLLTARVMVNRFWYLCFGSGLAGVLDDFGGQGEAPVHPELLDNLALEFVDSGWDVKQIMKRIVMSRTYRQCSAELPGNRDPRNRLYARQSRYRLPAEVVRDNALAISGLLVTGQGGDSVKPYQPPGYYRHLNFPTRTYKSHTDQRQWRRGVYVHWQRQFLHPMLRAFDAPTREECTAQRPRSNTPLAALTLLNDPTFVEAARVLAERILAGAQRSFDTRLDELYLRVLSRTPHDVERVALVKLFQSSERKYRAHPESARALVSVGQSKPPAALDVAELAAWTSVGRAVLNLDETITRN